MPCRPQVEAQIRVERQPAHLRAQLRGRTAVPGRERARGSNHQALHGLICAICGAPSMPLEGACVFCHAPITGEEDDSAQLLDYLVERIPAAKVKRGHLNRGPITEVVLDIAGRTFRARVKNEQLELLPPVHLTAWVALLLPTLPAPPPPHPHLPPP